MIKIDDRRLPYGKEEEEEADKKIDDVPETWILPTESLTWVPAPVPFVVVAEVAALQQSEVPLSHKVLSPRPPPVFPNDHPIEREEEEECKTKILSHLHRGCRPLLPEERFHYWVSDTKKASMN